MPNFSKLSPVTVILALLTACGDTSTINEANLEEVARGIHERVITLDTHADINTENFTPENNYTQNLDTQVNLPKMEAGGLDVAWFIVYTGQGELGPEGYRAAYANAMDKFSAILAWQKKLHRIRLRSPIPLKMYVELLPPAKKSP